MGGILRKLDSELNTKGCSQMEEGFGWGIDIPDAGSIREAGWASLEHGMARMGIWTFSKFSSVRMGNL